MDRTCQKDMETEEILSRWLEKTLGLGHRAAAGVSVSFPIKPMSAMPSGMDSSAGCPSTGWILLQCDSVEFSFGLLLKNIQDKFDFFLQEII